MPPTRSSGPATHEAPFVLTHSLSPNHRAHTTTTEPIDQANNVTESLSTAPDGLVGSQPSHAGTSHTTNPRVTTRNR
jgi:hypothetical protein